MSKLLLMNESVLPGWISRLARTNDKFPPYNLKYQAAIISFQS